MTWILVGAGTAAAWIMLGMLSSERKARADRIELQAAIERQRSINKTSGTAQTDIPVLSSVASFERGRPNPPN